MKIFQVEMKQYCRECGTKAINNRVERNKDNNALLYFLCSNPDCGHSWIANLTFSHSTKKSKLSILGACRDILENVTNEQQLAEIKAMIKEKEQQLLI